MINWKLRLQNKVTLMALIALIITFIYQALSLFGVIPNIPQKNIIDTISLFVDILCGLGVVTDPTTEGVYDSKQAMNYEKPKEKF